MKYQVYGKIPHPPQDTTSGDIFFKTENVITGVWFLFLNPTGYHTWWYFFVNRKCLHWGVVSYVVYGKIPHSPQDTTPGDIFLKPKMLSPVCGFLWYTCWRFLYRVLCWTASATRSYAKPERELQQGTQRLLDCCPQRLLLVSAVCGSIPR